LVLLFGIVTGGVARFDPSMIRELSGQGLLVMRTYCLH